MKHTSPHHPIRTPFGFSSTADEILSGIDLSGKRAIVTGASSGIGIDTARVLADAGADVTLAVRKLDAGLQVAAHLKAVTGNENISASYLDLSDQASIQAFVGSRNDPLHILVNNGGIMALPELTRTREGWEMQYATNFVGHFALTLGLHEALAAAGGARIVSVSSSGNLIAPVIWDDPHFDFMPYDPLVAYGQSKTACALLAVEATRRWSGDAIYANALNPGAIATGLQRHTGGLRTPPGRRKTTAQGAATSVLLAGSPLLEKIGGRYFEDCNEAEILLRRPGDYRGVAHYALDPANAARLWDMTLEMIDRRQRR
ncbi:SDR family NAD(P)-dependent oxidoreductase [Massilia niastensis]|uniref:SDR family NAD(P)-dependent oxidoreductase n=1 Tax=Massilia niastensis TaxID=544911 RepID=UPI0003739A93|nr:SDR family NAD(P)-dependent oxidoreductase [Massilia niastensis]